MGTQARRYRWPLVALAVVASLALAGFCWYRHRYPYGYSHCCIKAVQFALEQYADDHDGRYPAGQASPEASLSLLHHAPYDLDAEALRGKTVPVEIVRQLLDRGNLLGPDTCGWHYVEGLTQNDDRRLALLWDKVGLGHFGEHWPDGGREVVFVGGDDRIISGEEWPAFLAEQEQLHSRRDEAAVRGGPVLVARLRWPTGEFADHYDGRFEIEEHVVFPGGEGRGTARSGPVLRATNLEWKGKDFVPTEGDRTWVLSLPDRRLRSRPVRIKVANGTPSQPAIVFEMQKAE